MTKAKQRKDSELISLIWKTEQRKVSDLIPYEKNPRDMTADERAELADSMKKFNLVEIPAANLDNKLIAGHQRVKELIALGRGEEVIDVRVPNRMLTPEEFDEYLLRSNKNNGHWVEEMLNEHFSEDLLREIGFTDSEMDSIKNLKVDPAPDAPLEVEQDDFDETPPVNPITVPGDLYEFISGNRTHRALCADARYVDNLDKLFLFNLAKMIFTDPPYNVKISGLGQSGNKNSIGSKHGEFQMASGEMTKKEFIQFLKDIMTNLVLFSVKGSIHYLCMDWKHIYEISTAGEECYTELKNVCIWNKDNGGMGTFYRNKHELIFAFKHGTEKHINNFELGQHGRYRTNVWDYPIANSFANKDSKEELDMHPTVKPLQMVVDAILDCSHKGDIVADYFLGSGTTIIGSEAAERICYGTEIEPKYMDVIVRRYVKYMTKNNKEFQVLRNGVLLLEEELQKY